MHSEANLSDLDRSTIFELPYLNCRHHLFYFFKRSMWRTRITKSASISLYISKGASPCNISNFNTILTSLFPYCFVNALVQQIRPKEYDAPCFVMDKVIEETNAYLTHSMQIWRTLNVPIFVSALRLLHVHAQDLWQFPCISSLRLKKTKVNSFIKGVEQSQSFSQRLCMRYVTFYITLSVRYVTLYITLSVRDVTLCFTVSCYICIFKSDNPIDYPGCSAAIHNIVWNNERATTSF